MKRKISLMHEMFGSGNDGETCRTCCHLQNDRYHDRSYYKCECYGITASEASDWRLKYPSCGLYNKPYPLGRTVMEFKKHEGNRKEEIQVKGQMSLRLLPEEDSDEDKNGSGDIQERNQRDV